MQLVAALLKLVLHFLEDQGQGLVTGGELTQDLEKGLPTLVATGDVPLTKSFGHYGGDQLAQSILESMSGKLPYGLDDRGDYESPYDWRVFAACILGV